VIRPRATLALLALTSSIAACGPPAPDAPLSMDQLAEFAAVEGGVVHTYGMPDSYGGYEVLFAEFEQEYGIQRLDIDMSSSATLQRLTDERDEPVVDAAVVGYLYGPAAEEADLVDCVPSPAAVELVDWASGPRGGDCRGWFASYTGTLGFLVNLEVVEEPPRTWQDLLRDDLKGKVSFVDPRAAATGVGTLLAAAMAQGGSAASPGPGVELLATIAHDGGGDNVLVRQDYARFVRGTLPVLINYDYNQAQLAQTFGIDSTFVVPADGTIQMPYSTLLVRNRPHTFSGRLLMEYMLGERGQALLAEGHVTPIRDGVLTPSSRAVPSDDPRIMTVPWDELTAQVEAMKAAYGQAVADLEEPRP
jgi:putative spermidine/putrescine transport system substrate-binding protein